MDLKRATAKILVVDDNEPTRELLRDSLRSAGYEVISAKNGKEALQKVKEETLDLILLDVMMPEVDGYEVCAKLKGDEETRLIPIVMLSVLSDLSDKMRAIEVGADDFLNKPVSRIELLTRVRSLVRVKYLNEALENVKNVIFSLSAAIEANDPYVRGHSERVSQRSAYFAKQLGLSDKVQDILMNAGMLHDLGKIGISRDILHKPGPLTESEFAQIKAHPLYSEKICQPLRSTSLLLPIIRHHQERYDGKGYPDRLEGKNIPLGARILAITDAYDALTSERPYRSALSKEEALKVLKEGAGTQWDPELIKKFISMLTREKEKVEAK